MVDTGFSPAQHPLTIGTYAYYSGVSGTVNVAASKRVLSISAHCSVLGSLTINGGSSITIPASTGIEMNIQGNLTAPTVVFTSTDSYMIEVV